MTSSSITTRGQLERSPWGQAPLRGRTVKLELRRNVLARLRAQQPVFPSVVGYDDTVVPALVNAVLSRHSFILLGLRGQAKSRILRGLVDLLDEVIPAIAGCEIHDDPFAPICKFCRQRVAADGDATPIAWIPRAKRFVEKLATPDVTVADIIGDLDPIRAAREGLDLADERTMHYGLLPRAHRGIFALNELPDLAGKVQVSLFNIMQEGDVQLKGYPIRLPLDVTLVFTANPEDYTARGKIITPLKDRIGSEVRTHYPATLQIGMAITGKEAWIEREGRDALVPDYILEIVEGIAFAARSHPRVDKRSGVSQRLPISCLENVISSAERRAARAGTDAAFSRIADIYAAAPAITGKIELEYEGEQEGAQRIVEGLIRSSVAAAFDRRFDGQETAPSVATIVQWFDQGEMLQLEEDASDEARLKELDQVPGLVRLARRVAHGDHPGELAGAAELVLEGLCGKKRISRTDDRVFMKSAPEMRSRGMASQLGFGPGGRFDDDLMQ